MPLKNPPHPGEILREDVINALGLSEAEVAKMLGVSQNEIALVINNKGPITPDLAFKFESAGWSTAKSWLQMQRNYDLTSMPDNEGEVLNQIAEHFEPLVPNTETIDAMKEARKGGLKSLATVDDLMTDLNEDN